VGAPTIIVALN